MQALEPQTRFLLRGSALLIGLLALWWFVPFSPMLYVLKGAAGLFMQIEHNVSGGWTVRVPVQVNLPPTKLRPRAQQLRSIDFDLSPGDALTFTYSLPVFWALMLAGPDLRRNFRNLLIGTGLTAAVELALLLAFAQITGTEQATQLAGGNGGVGHWLREVGAYLVVNVIPYAAPFAIALALHSKLASELFGLSGEVGKRKGQPPTKKERRGQALNNSARRRVRY